MRIWLRSFFFLLCGLTLCDLSSSAAETGETRTPHRVLLAPRAETKSSADQRWYPRPVSPQLGRVTQFDSEQISIVLSGQATPTRFASQRVLGIELAHVPEDQDQAINAFDQGDYSTALPALIRSISEHDAASRPPVWRQQWLSMLAAQAAMRGGRGEIAIELVTQLDARPMPAMTLALLPIDWTGEVAKSDEMFAAATARAGSESLAVKLVVASWLLHSSEYRTAAESELRRLAVQQERPTIAAYAGQLLWRTKSPPEVQAELGRWESEIAQLPMSIRTGPMILIRHLSQRSGSADAAKKWEMTLQLAAPAWHPDLPSGD